MYPNKLIRFFHMSSTSRYRVVMMVIAITLFIAGCAPKKAPEGWLQDKGKVQSKLKELDGRQASQIQLIEQQRAQNLILEKRFSQNDINLAALEMEINSLKGLIVSLKETIEEYRRTIPTPKKPVPKPTKKPIKAPAKIAPPPEATPKPDPQAAIKALRDEEERYKTAFLTLKSGRYDEANAAFNKLLTTYPRGRLADMAHFWLGESYFTEGKLSKAEEAFKEVINKFPKSSKHGAALLKLGLTYKALGHSSDARSAFRRLRRLHPDSPEAEIAREYLKLMKPRNTTAK